MIRECKNTTGAADLRGFEHHSIGGVEQIWVR